jgi:hypothetical protein
MSDQCRHCQSVGKWEECQATACFQHENWYAEQFRTRIAELEVLLREMTESHDFWKREWRLMESAEKAAEEEITKLRGTLGKVAPMVCEYLCPSVKKTGTEWTHVDICMKINALLLEVTWKE